MPPLKQQQEKDDQLILVEEDLIGLNIRDEGAVGGGEMSTIERVVWVGKEGFLKEVGKSGTVEGEKIEEGCWSIDEREREEEESK